MTATSLDLSQIRTDALSSAATFRTLIGLGSGDTPTFKGATLSTGTITASTPAVDISQTWNSSGVTFTGSKINITDTASASGSLLADWQVGGVSRFSFTKNNSLLVGTTSSFAQFHFRPVSGSAFFAIQAGSGSTSGIYFGDSSGDFSHRILRQGNDQDFKVIGTMSFFTGGPAVERFSISGAGLAVFTGGLEQRNLANAQTFRIYNTTDAGLTNYERGQLAWESNEWRIGTAAAGTGTLQNIVIGSWNSSGTWARGITFTLPKSGVIPTIYISGYDTGGTGRGFACRGDTTTGRGVFSTDISAGFQFDGVCVGPATTTSICYSTSGIIAGRDSGSSFSLTHGAYFSDVAARFVTLSAANAFSSATTNISGGSFYLLGGAGASGSAGAANGGHIYLDGGQGYGTGVHGSLYLGSTRLTSVYLTPTSLTGSQATSALDISQTWNTSGTPTLIKANVTDTASNAASLLLNLQVGGSSMFKVDKTGALSIGTPVAGVAAKFESTGNGLRVVFDTTQTTEGFFIRGTDGVTYWRIGSVLQSRNSYIQLVENSNIGTINVGAGQMYLTHASGNLSLINTYGNLQLRPGNLSSGPGNAVEIINGVNAQSFRLYRTASGSPGTDYERLALYSTSYSAAIYKVIAAESGGTGAANINMVVSPKGTGAFMLRVPDGTGTGGNARGQYAVDLQMTGGALNVASGNYTFIGGGAENRASAGYSVACGGFSNNSSGNYSTICGGIANTASGENSTSIGGFINVASGSSSTTIGGYKNTSSGAYSVSAGREAKSDRQYMYSFGSNKFADNGDAQKTEFVLRIKTTDATATTLMLGDDTTRLTIPSGKVFAFVAKISGIKSDGSAVAFYTRKGAIKNVGGTTSLVGSIETIGTDTEDNASTDVAITADDTNDALQINVTGIAAETWRWVAVVEGIEIGYGT